ncbi:hypothetical protein KY285_008176 [Solanum tuberosum]|nr:hypothetical protein KY285_008176 [Solanum tuberosum]
MSFELITLRFYHGGVMKIGKKGYKGKPYHGGGVYEFLDVDIDRTTHEAQENAIHEAQEPASNPAPANSNTSSHVHSFTAPNTPLPTHQTLTPIHLSTDPTLDLVHPFSDPISDPVHHSNEQDSDRESLNWGGEGI